MGATLHVLIRSLYLVAVLRIRFIAMEVSLFSLIIQEELSMRRLRMSLVQPQSFICKIQGPVFSERITKSGKTSLRGRVSRRTRADTVA